MRNTALPHVIRATAVAAIAVLPPFVTSAMYVQMKADIELSEATLGAAIACFFVGSASMALLVGRLADRHGARRLTSLGAASSVLGMSGLAVLGNRPADVVIALLFAGLGNGSVQPAANRALSDGIGSDHVGAAFGLKQASVPAATLLAGALLTLTESVVSWRVALVVVAALAAAMPLIVPTVRRWSSTVAEPLQNRKAVLWVAATSALGSASAAGLAGFYVPYLGEVGIAESTSGVLLMMASILVMVSRLGFGWISDHKWSDIEIAGPLLAIGSVGLWGFAVGSVHLAALVGVTALAFGAGWGWPGLLFSASVRSNRGRAATATGYVQAGASSGAVTGVAVFGLLAAGVGFTAAWAASAFLALAAVACSRVASRRLSESSGSRYHTPKGS